jgi:hypothetical protein
MGEGFSWVGGVEDTSVQTVGTGEGEGGESVELDTEGGAGEGDETVGPPKVGFRPAGQTI